MRYRHEARYFAPDTSSAAREAMLTRLAEYLLDMHGGIFAALRAVTDTVENGTRDERDVRAMIRRVAARRRAASN